MRSGLAWIATATASEQPCDTRPYTSLRTSALVISADPLKLDTLTSFACVCVCVCVRSRARTKRYANGMADRTRARMPALAHRVSRPRGTGSVGAGHRVSRR
jgi:hypothetical protein